MNSSKYSSKKPIVLIVKAKQPADAIEIALERQFSLKKDGDTLSLSIGQESVTVPTQCHDSLRLLIHHHDIYRQTSTALLALPHPSPLVPIYLYVATVYTPADVPVHLLPFKEIIYVTVPPSPRLLFPISVFSVLGPRATSSFGYSRVRHFPTVPPSSSPFGWTHHATVPPSPRPLLLLAK
ncbi:hypothetical protein DFH29DRAFT_883663 [Suillus ampliporus]|nr:hypothetical protein DFH29DRAFT_883663 [Suillus ampliporus]